MMGVVERLSYAAGQAAGWLYARWRFIARLVAFVLTFVVIVWHPGISVVVLLVLWVSVGLLTELANTRHGSAASEPAPDDRHGIAVSRDE